MAPVEPDEAVTGLLEVLRTGKPDERQAAVRALAGLGPRAAAAATAIIEALRDDDAAVRHEAARALGSWDKSAVPLLIDLLRNEATDADFHRAIIVTLGQLGKAAQPAIPTLTEALKNELLTEAASEALQQIVHGQRNANWIAVQTGLQWAVGILFLASVLGAMLSMFVRPRDQVAALTTGLGLATLGVIGLLLARRGKIHDPEQAATWPVLLLWTVVLSLGGCFLGLVVWSALESIVRPLGKGLGQ